MKKLIIALYFISISLLIAQTPRLSDYTGTNEYSWQIGRKTKWIKLWSDTANRVGGVPTLKAIRSYGSTIDTVSVGGVDTTSNYVWLGKHTFKNIVQFDSTMIQTGNHSFYNNFTAGWTGTGFIVDYGNIDTNKSSIEVDNIKVRGSMDVYELIVNQIRGENGNQIWSSVAKADSAYGNYIRFDDPTGNNLCPFAVNDLIMSQRWNPTGSAVIRQVIATVTSVSGRTIGVSYNTGTALKGDTFVRFGNTTNTARQGCMYFATIDTYAPYMQIIDGVSSVSGWSSSSKVKVMLGELTGYTSSVFGALSGYGAWFRDKLYIDKGNIYLGSGGSLSLGKTSYSSTTAGFWMGDDGGTYKINFGNSTNYLHWTGSALNVAGSINILNPTTAFNGDSLNASQLGNDLNWDNTLTKLTSGVSLTAGGITLGTASYLRSGKTSYSSTTAGFFIGAESGTPKVNIGDASSYFKWTGSALQIAGSVVISNPATFVNNDSLDLSYLQGTLSADKVLVGTNTLTYEISEKNNVTRSTTAPTVHLSTGDIWIDTDDGDKPYTYNGSIWVRAYSILSGGDLINGSVTTDKITATSLSAISATLGSVIVGTSSTAGYLQSYDYVASTSGWKIAKGLAEFNGATLYGGSLSIGSGNNILKADANGLYLGNATFASAPFRVSMAGALIATTAKLGTSLDYWSIQNSTMTAVSNSNDVIINHGKTDFGQDATAGFILGYDASALKSKFEIGSTATGLLKYDGSLSLTGGTITGGTVQTATSGQRVLISGANKDIRIFSASTEIVQVGLLGTGSYGLRAKAVTSEPAYVVLDNGDFSGGLGTIYAILGTDVDAGGSFLELHDATNETAMSSDGGFITTGALSIGNTKFTVNSTGQLTKINNLAASSYAGYLLASDETSFTPTLDLTKTYSGSYYLTVSNTEGTNTSAVSGFYAKANQGGYQAGLAMQAFPNQHSDATLAGYARLVSDVSMNGLILGVGSGDLISFRVNNTEYAKVTSGGLTTSALTFSSANNTAPSNTTTPVAWKTVVTSDGTYKIPLYQ